MHTICDALSTRLRTPDSLKSPDMTSGQSPQHLQIMSNNIAPVASETQSSGGHSTPLGSLGSRKEGLLVFSLATATSIAGRARASLGDLKVDVSEGEAGGAKHGEGDTGAIPFSESVGAEIAVESDDGEEEKEEEGSDWDDWSEDEDVSAVEE